MRDAAAGVPAASANSPARSRAASPSAPAGGVAVSLGPRARGLFLTPGAGERHGAVVPLMIAQQRFGHGLADQRQGVVGAAFGERGDAARERARHRPWRQRRRNPHASGIRGDRRVRGRGERQRGDGISGLRTDARPADGDQGAETQQQGGAAGRAASRGLPQQRRVAVGKSAHELLLEEVPVRSDIPRHARVIETARPCDLLSSRERMSRARRPSFTTPS